MAIANKFLYFSTVSAYNTAKTAGNIAPGSIVFVDQPYVAAHDEVAEIPAQRFIETHDKQFHANQAFNSIKAAIEALDVTDLTNSDASTRGVTITLNEVDGKVTSLAISDLAGAKLGSYSKGESDAAIAAGDTIAAALAKLENQIANKIGALDSDVAAGADKYFTGIELKDGKLVGTSETGSKTTVANVDSAKIVDYVANSANAEQSLSTSDTIAGAIAKVERNIQLEKAAREALDFDSTTVTGHAANKPIIAVNQIDGQVGATEGTVKSEFITYTPQVVTPASGTEGEEGYTPAVMDTNKTDIQEATKEIYGKIRDLTASSALTLVDANNTAATTVKADGTTYKLKQGTSVVAQFNIMKETFLDTSATGLVWFKTAPSEFATTGTTTGESTPTDYAEWTDAEKKAAVAYLKLVMRTDADGNSGTTGDTTVNAYIPAASLIATYTGAAASDGVITVAVSDANVITATIGDNTIVWGKLATALQNKIDSKKTTITEIAQGNPADKHILVTKTAGSEADGTGDNYVITEVDIASDSDLTAEVTRAKSAETAIDAEIGLTKGANDETRSYSNTGNYIGKDATKNTVKSDIKALDTQVKTNTDAIGVLNGGDSVSGSVAKSIKDAIAGLDAEVESTGGTFATVTVTEADGKITGVTVAEGNADDIKISSEYAKATGTIAAVAANDSIETAIEKVEGKVDKLNSGSPFEYATDHESTKSTVLKGEGNVAQNEGEVAIGFYNSSVTSNSAASGRTTFSVGNGTSTSARSNAFEVRENGDVYVHLPIGTLGADVYSKLQEILANEINWYEG